MKKLVHEIVGDVCDSLGYPQMRIGEVACSMLQESAENYLVLYFQKAVLNMVHAGRITLMKKDFDLISSQIFIESGVSNDTIKVTRKLVGYIEGEQPDLLVPAAAASSSVPAAGASSSAPAGAASSSAPAAAT